MIRLRRWPYQEESAVHLTAVLLLSLVVDCSSGQKVDLDVLADDLARRDVVFLGELHDNSDGHRFQLDLLKALHERRPDLVLSMEMFERDVQGIMDDYLRGRIDEKKFLAHSRPWPNYKPHYRPLVEFAREHGLDVIAANVPRPLASLMASKGPDAIRGKPYVARRSSAPADRYWEEFKAAMSHHPHGGGEGGEEMVKRMYLAQCLKDDTMAESIDDYLSLHRSRQPLVVHVTGKFHSDYGLGTVVRLLARRPLAQAGVVGSAELPADAKELPLDDNRDRAHYMLFVKPQPRRAPPQPKAKPQKPRKRGPVF